MRDTVQFHVTSDLPIRSRALVYAGRAEIRFGKAFPVALVVDYDAIDELSKALADARDALAEALKRTSTNHKQEKNNGDF